MTFPGGVKKGAASEVLGYVLYQFHTRVEKLKPEWCWGYYYRSNRNDPNSLSNHSSATAVDANAPAHPNGVPTAATFKDWQIKEIHKILDEVDDVVRWGGDYNYTVDSMHFELNENMARVRTVAERLKHHKVPLKTKVKGRLRRRRARARKHDGLIHLDNVDYGKHNRDVREVQVVLTAWYPHDEIEVDGIYGKQTANALRRVSNALNLPDNVNENERVRRKVLKKLGFRVINN